MSPTGWIQDGHFLFSRSIMSLRVVIFVKGKGRHFTFPWKSTIEDGKPLQQRVTVGISWGSVERLELLASTIVA